MDESGLPDAARRLLALPGSGTTEAVSTTAPHRSWATRIGQTYFDAWSKAVAIAALVGETALRGSAAFAGRARTRGSDVMQCVREAGVGALGIVAIVNGLVGAIIAFVGAVQLQRFGAGIYVADLVGIAVARELAALITAIVMAGRTGGAYAAHLATMQGNEEIDALKAFGIPVFDFLVMPRIVALVAMMPLLYLYGCAVGFLGGFVVSIATVDLTAVSFVEEFRSAVAGRQFAIGLAKSIAFGALVALAGCYIGLQAGRSAADVGRAATAAVVVGIVGVIALDAVFAVCTNTLGI
jgi:phospholipid/cholesterol/gamma-HCH transport system permease protein